MFNKTFSKLSKHYDDLFEKYGDNVKSSQQSNNLTRKRRLKILTQEIKLSKNTSVLDFGCGTGYLLEFLKNNKFKGKYTGIDISKKVIEHANKKKNYKNAEFLNINLMNSKINKKYDYIIVNGTFNNNTSNNWKWIKRILKILFKQTKKGLFFNNLSYYVDYKDKKLFYIKPEKVFNFCKVNLSQYVTIKNDYLIKKKSIPFEFTTFVFKNNYERF